MDFDVAVIGAGPAGASAALPLAQHGLRVAIVEKARLPRYKTCGGAILQRAVRSLPIDITPAVERECRVVQMNLSPRLRFQSRRPFPIISMTMRDAFDHLLVDAAVARGAVLLQGCEVANLSSIAARFIIAADGANSFIARAAGWTEDRLIVPALEWEVEVESADVPARFDFDGVDHGYAWVFPKRRHLSIGVLSWSPQNLNDACESYIRRLGIRPISIQRHGYVIPLSPRKRFATDRIFLTGDAAGFADPVTAEGITFAIRSGQYAARAIIEGKPRLYEEMVEQLILPELRIARKLAHLLYCRPRTRNALFALCGNRLIDAMTRIVTGEASYSSVTSISS